MCGRLVWAACFHLWHGGCVGGGEAESARGGITALASAPRWSAREVMQMSGTARRSQMDWAQLGERILAAADTMAGRGSTADLASYGRTLSRVLEEAIRADRMPRGHEPRVR
jgi:hypothetical protein